MYGIYQHYLPHTVDSQGTRCQTWSYSRSHGSSLVTCSTASPLKHSKGIGRRSCSGQWGWGGGGVGRGGAWPQPHWGPGQPPCPLFLPPPLTSERSGSDWRAPRSWGPRSSWKQGLTQTWESILGFGGGWLVFFLIAQGRETQRPGSGKQLTKYHLKVTA